MPRIQKRFVRTRRLIFVIATAYLGILILLIAIESKFIFHPTPEKLGWWKPPRPGFQDITVTSATGDQIHCWWLPRKDSNHAVLFSHGNGGNLSLWGKALVKWWEQLESSVLIYDYPGYGRSTGSPTEAGCYAAAEAAWNCLTESKQIAAEKITLVGESLGGAMAIDLATRHPYRALVVYKTLTSVPDMASDKFPWLPARYLVRTQFDNLSKIKQCRGPFFLYHGELDPVIPFSQGEKLFQAAPGPKEIYADPTGDHGNLPTDFYQRIDAFLQRHAPN